MLRTIKKKVKYLKVDSYITQESDFLVGINFHNFYLLFHLSNI